MKSLMLTGNVLFCSVNRLLQILVLCMIFRLTLSTTFRPKTDASKSIRLAREKNWEGDSQDAVRLTAAFLSFLARF
jgi:hypothetical protein